MGKILLIIFVVYFLYYAGNIVYDLFLKKETAIKDDNAEVYSVGDLADQAQPAAQTVDVEDVENLVLTKNNSDAFVLKGDNPNSAENTQENGELPEIMKRKILEEEDLAKAQEQEDGEEQKQQGQQRINNYKAQMKKPTKPLRKISESFAEMSTKDFYGIINKADSEISVSKIFKAQNADNPNLF